MTWRLALVLLVGALLCQSGAAKDGWGVLFSAYSTDTARTLPRYLGEAAKSATAMRALNPELRYAVIANHDFASLNTSHPNVSCKTSASNVRNTVLVLRCLIMLCKFDATTCSMG